MEHPCCLGEVFWIDMSSL